MCAPKWEWCNVAFEWTDKGFWILWGPRLAVKNNAFVCLDQQKKIPVHNISNLKTGWQGGIEHLPYEIKLLWGSAFETARKDGADLWLKQGVWPVARGDDGSNDPWSLVSYDYVYYDDGSRWVGFLSEISRREISPPEKMLLVM